MARGSKDYDKVTHGATDKSATEKQKAVWDMVGAKKKLHEMVEALIGGDSKAAAAALHDYLQTKTRAVLGENDMDMDMDLGDEEGLDDEGEGEGEGMKCPPECDDPEHHHDDEEHDEHDVEDVDGEEFGHDEHDFEEPTMEGAEGGKKTSFGAGKSPSNAAPDLGRKVKGKVKFKSNGKAKLTHPHNNAAPGLDRKVKGDIDFNGKGSAKLTHPHNNAAPGLDRKVKGKVKFGN